jgi:hypothetical protein
VDAVGSAFLCFMSLAAAMVITLGFGTWFASFFPFFIFISHYTFNLPPGAATLLSVLKSEYTTSTNDDLRITVLFIF